MGWFNNKNIKTFAEEIEEKKDNDIKLWESAPTFVVYELGTGEYQIHFKEDIYKNTIIYSPLCNEYYKTKEEANKEIDIIKLKEIQKTKLMSLRSTKKLVSVVSVPIYKGK